MVSGTRLLCSPQEARRRVKRCRRETALNPTTCKGGRKSIDSVHSDCVSRACYEMDDQRVVLWSGETGERTLEFVKRQQDAARRMAKRGGPV